MQAVVVAGAREPFTERLAEDLGAALGGCRLIEPGGEGDAFAAGDTVIYPAGAGVGLACVPDLAVAGRLFERAVAAGTGHLVVIGSVAVHEPNAHHPGHLDEARAVPRRRGNAVARGWAELEQSARRAVRESATALSLLRPVAVVTRGGGDYFSRLLSGRWAFVPPGFDPSLQLLSPGDLAAAVARVVEKGPGSAGVYHLAPRAVMPLKKALKTARCRWLPVPLAIQRPMRRALGPRHAAPIEQLDYLRYPSTVSAAKISRELGFEPRHSSAEAIQLAIGSRAIGSRATGSRATGPSGVEATPALPGVGATPASPDFDDFGLDKDYVAHLGRTLFRFLHDAWWRVEWRGLEHVPRRGRAVLAGIHRGHQPWDGVMTFHLLVRELGRYPRYLIHPTLAKFPFLTPYLNKCGGIHACRENAAWVLEREGLLAIFPEGIRGAFTMYRDAYKLGKFGRDEYVKIALRHRAPIVPYVTVGSAEIFPILGRIDWKWWQRLSEWPFFPVTPTMGTVPLPSKWHTLFLEPISVDGHPPEAADDRSVVEAISGRVRRRMETAFAQMRERRKSIWGGSVFEEAGV